MTETQSLIEFMGSDQKTQAYYVNLRFEFIITDYTMIYYYLYTNLFILHSFVDRITI